MLYSCAHVATVGVKGLTQPFVASVLRQTCRFFVRRFALESSERRTLYEDKKFIEQLGLGRYEWECGTSRSESVLVKGKGRRWSKLRIMCLFVLLSVSLYPLFYSFYGPCCLK